ncbi:MAG: helix-turn-helix domain-containing protein [Lachnospiraceae bacterium]|nr:helix-turn-helix domain-containing protein [Lachnospiraceae bacterium]
MDTNQRQLKEQKLHGHAGFACAGYIADYHPESPKACDVPYHWHDELEIIYIKKGTFTYQKNVDAEIIDEECFLLIGAGNLHKLYCEQDYHEEAVVFSPKLLEFSYEDRAMRKILNPFINNQLHFPGKITKTDPLFEPFKAEFNQIIEVFQKENEKNSDQFNANHAFSQLLIKTSLLRILGLLYASGRFSEEVPANEQHIERMKVILSYIETHYSEKIYLEDLASLVGLNEQYFSRQFKSFFGQAPMKYLMTYRLKKACKKLSQTNMSVTDIAYECGFLNLGHFMTEFKKMTGQTPKEYRKRV